MTSEQRIDTTERDLRIAVTQARDKGGEALKIAQEKLQKYLASRLSLQIQHSKMAIAANEADKLKIIGINDD